MASMKDSWKQAGKGMGTAGKSIGYAFRDLGKSLIRTASVGAKKADDWANHEEQEETVAVETEKKDEE